MTFPIAAVPDSLGDGFEEPVCEECEGTGIIMRWNVTYANIGYGVTGPGQQVFICGCRPEEE